MFCTANNTSQDCKSKGFSVKCFNAVHEIPDSWDELANINDRFLSLPYLKHIELNSPEIIAFRYAMLYKQNDLAAICYFQISPFQAKKSLNHSLESNKTAFSWVKNKIAELIGFDTIMCGNIYLTGEHGFAFNRDLIAPEEFGEHFNYIVNRVEKEYQILTKHTTAVLVKDFYEDRHPFHAIFQKAGLKHFQIQPNMIMPIRKEWTDFETYLSCMNTKARTRVKRGFKKLDNIKVISINKILAESYQDQINHLHRQVADQSSFNTVKISKEYIIDLLDAFPNEYEMLGFFEGEKMLGFCTYFIFGKQFTAHFLGFEKELNHDKQLYFNMLLQMVKKAINNQCTEIVFARTALEIKSSVGAHAIEMDCYMRHSNPILNQLVVPVVNYLNPKVEWIPRHPFKD